MDRGLQGVLLADWEKLSKILDPKDRSSWQTTSPARISSDVTLADIRFTVRHDQEVRREGRLDKKNSAIVCALDENANCALCTENFEHRSEWHQCQHRKN